MRLPRSARDGSEMTEPGTRSVSVALGTLVFSWVVVAIAPWIESVVPWRSDYDPRLPIVSVIPWDRTSDVMSSVPSLFKALLFAGLGALIVEVSKGILWSSPRRVHWLLLAYQFGLAADTLRTYAPDWWVWITYFLGLRFSGPEQLDTGIGLPWASLVTMIALVVYLWIQTSGGADSTPSTR